MPLFLVGFTLGFTSCFLNFYRVLDLAEVEHAGSNRRSDYVHQCLRNPGLKSFRLGVFLECNMCFANPSPIFPFLTFGGWGGGGEFEILWGGSYLRSCVNVQMYLPDSLPNVFTAMFFERG